MTRSPRSRPVILVDPELGVSARPSSGRERWAARTHAVRLDLALARGASPESDAALAVRAGVLASARFRRLLAESVGRMVEQSDRPRSAVASRTVPICVDRVVEARPELEDLRAHLLAPAPVAARGVALVSVLLSDGSGPLYRAASRDDLRARVRAAVLALDPACDWPA